MGCMLRAEGGVGTGGRGRRYLTLKTPLRLTKHPKGHILKLVKIYTPFLEGETESLG